MSFEDIAKELGISRALVYRTYCEAIKKLKSPKNKDKWQAIFETIDLIQNEKAKRKNSIQGGRRC
ncbi:RNA polymerase subunit sigma-70 [Campylobacter sp. MIT 99-7217]|uniref:sigma-70 family RNA polymerase sigma factor n=1 Tax=Campylobacter sp. MIT 99-7217 TaxID=535091 RepID=UPI001159C868|nr:sigma-70 family RNA polymerase sigma factor [Campylobacter sp. MIT 99-7217]TQR29177.1 RNA polymerase subunit sigma-70 [Campylobacter sp. MIT 99-7217]